MNSKGVVSTPSGADRPWLHGTAWPRPRPRPCPRHCPPCVPRRRHAWQCLPAPQHAAAARNQSIVKGRPARSGRCLGDALVLAAATRVRARRCALAALHPITDGMLSSTSLRPAAGNAATSLELLDPNGRGQDGTWTRTAVRRATLDSGPGGGPAPAASCHRAPSAPGSSQHSHRPLHEARYVRTAGAFRAPQAGPARHGQAALRRSRQAQRRSA